MADTKQGYGQQDPTDNANPFNAREFHIQRVLARTRTATVVKVIAVDKDALTVDVLPIVQQLDGQNNATPHTTVYGIPYTRAQGGKNAVIIEPEAGDLGLMVCADRDISAVKSTKAAAPPGSGRRFSFSDGIYIGGMLNGAPEQWVKFTDTGLELADKNNNKLTSGPGGWVFTGVVTLQNNLQLGGAILGANGAQYPGNLHITGTVTGDADVVAAGKSLKAHTHPVTSAPGTTGPNN